MQYNGAENLDVMALAENYNNALVNWLVPELETAEKIVDFGAGSAYLLRRIEDKLKRKILAVEPADNWDGFYAKHQILRCHSLEEVQDETLDAIYTLSVLEHIRDDKDMVQLMWQKLRPGGKLLVYVPALPFLYSAMDKKVGHYRRYTKQALLELFDDSWQVSYMRYVDILGVAASIGLKYFGAKDGNLNSFAVKIFDRFIYPVSLICDKITQGKIIGKNLCLCAQKKLFVPERKVFVRKVSENRDYYGVKNLGECGVNFEKNIGKIQP